MKLRKDRLFLVVMVLFTVAYLVLMTLRFTTAAPVTAAVETHTDLSVIKTMALVPVAQAEELTAEDTKVNTPIEVPVAGFALMANEVVTVNDTKTYTDDDLYLLAKLIHCEAGIDNMAGKLAVGTVVMNRAKHDNQNLFGGPTIEGVIYHKLSKDSAHQFSCVDDEALWSEEPSEEAFEAAQKVLEGYRVFNDTYVYYYNPAICDGINGVVCDLEIGKHVFGHE